jgi:hypothetical protein
MLVSINKNIIIVIRASICLKRIEKSLRFGGFVTLYLKQSLKPQLYSILMNQIQPMTITSNGSVIVFLKETLALPVTKGIQQSTGNLVLDVRFVSLAIGLKRGI